MAELHAFSEVAIRKCVKSSTSSLGCHTWDPVAAHLHRQWWNRSTLVMLMDSLIIEKLL